MWICLVDIYSHLWQARNPKQPAQVGLSLPFLHCLPRYSALAEEPGSGSSSSVTVKCELVILVLLQSSVIQINKLHVRRSQVGNRGSDSSTSSVSGLSTGSLEEIRLVRVISAFVLLTSRSSGYRSFGNSPVSKCTFKMFSALVLSSLICDRAQLGLRPRQPLLACALMLESHCLVIRVAFP